MTGPTHIGIGVAALIGISQALSSEPTAASFVAITLGSLAPDLDSGRALIARPGNLLRHFLPQSFRKLLNGLGLTVSKIIAFTTGHRGPLHYPVLPISLFGVAAYEHYPLLAWFAIGYLLHLVADMLTVSGIPVFGPLSRRRISLLPLRTGSFVEGLVCFGVWLAVLFLVREDIGLGRYFHSFISANDAEHQPAARDE